MTRACSVVCVGGGGAKCGGRSGGGSGSNSLQGVNVFMPTHRQTQIQMHSAPAAVPRLERQEQGCTVLNRAQQRANDSGLGRQLQHRRFQHLWGLVDGGTITSTTPSIILNQDNSWRAFLPCDCEHTQHPPAAPTAAHSSPAPPSPPPNQHGTQPHNPTQPTWHLAHTTHLAVKR